MTLLRVFLGLLFAGTGVMHFVAHRFFERQVPPWVPGHRLVVALTGAAEVVIGASLLAAWNTTVAAWAAAALLVAFAPVHVHALRCAGTRSQRLRELLFRVPVNAAYVAIAVIVATA